MEIDNFDKRFEEFERKTSIHFDRDNGAIHFNRRVLKLLYVLNSETGSELTLVPNAGVGDFLLCAGKSDAYFASNSLAENAKKCFDSNAVNIYESDFLNTEIVGKYKSVLLIPPLGIRDNRGHLEELYIEKSLRLLANEGVAIFFVPQNILSAPAYRKIRERIIQNYSLEAVFSLYQVSEATSARFSVLMVKNRKQIDNIFMSLEEDYDDNLFEGYKSGKKGFYVPAIEVFDRFDANFYDPKYKETREKIQSRDTIKLGDVADIFSGHMIPSEERKKYGEYLIIKPRNIHGGEIEFDNNDKVYCSKEFVSSNERNKKSIVKNGDVLISTFGAITWAIYRGEDDYAIVNQHVAIIRGKKKYEKLLKLFFFSHTGIESLRIQLKFIEHGAMLNHISLRGLADMYVPDLHVMETAERLNKAADLEAKASSLFKELGWEVDECFEDNRYSYDLALRYKGKIHGVVEIKTYKSEILIDNPSLSRKLAEMKKQLGDVFLYLFVDDGLYSYDEGRLEQLCELPRPGVKDSTVRDFSKEEVEKGFTYIEQAGNEETSVTDSFLLEVINNELVTRLERIEHKVDSINEKLEELSKQINGFQSLVNKQLDLAITKNEEERIIQAFSNECTERILKEIKSQESDKIYNDEKNKLIKTFGEEAWMKMDEKSKTFLISSKVLYLKLDGMDIVDYSGVCLLVTKALEVEMCKRFCKNFLAYLKEKYPGKSNYTQFPVALLNEYGKPCQVSRFTMGGFAYVLCYLKGDNYTEEQIKNNKSKLIEYSKEKLFSQMSDDEMFDLLQDYAESIEEVRKDYRNPSAHTDELKKVDAEECFDLVIDVEKLLKRMLDSFIA